MTVAYSSEEDAYFYLCVHLCASCVSVAVCPMQIEDFNGNTPLQSASKCNRDKVKKKNIKHYICHIDVISLLLLTYYFSHACEIFCVCVVYVTIRHACEIFIRHAYTSRVWDLLCVRGIRHYNCHDTLIVGYVRILIWRMENPTGGQVDKVAHLEWSK